MKKLENFKLIHYRVEDKYALSKIEFERLRSKFLSVLPVDMNQTYCISSLYFDDYKDTCLVDTINGQPMREKFRIRIYNNSLNTIKLEHKIKVYSRIHKDSLLLNEQELRRLMQGQTIDSNEPVANVFNCAVSTRYLRPKVIVSYDRTAFIYKQGNVRITFDENLRASKDLACFGSQDVLYDYPRTSFRVLEVKYDGFLPDFIADLLEHGNMWQSANSKYRCCREIYQK